MKITKYIYILLLVSLASSACRETEAPGIDIPFSAMRKNATTQQFVNADTVQVGDSVRFTFGYGADALALYPGNAGSEFINSALYNLKKDDNRTQYIPTDTRYGIYTLDSKAETTNPPSLAAGGTATLVSQKADTLILFNTTGTTDNNEILIRPDIALFPNAADPAIPTTNLNRNLNINVQFLGGMPGQQIVLRTSLKIDGVYTNAAVAAGRVDNTVTLSTTKPDTLVTLAINLPNLLSNWISSNPSKTYGKIQEIKIQVGVGANRRFTGQFGIRSISLGSIIYRPWDTGVGIKYTAPNTPVSYDYVYNTPGTYIATMVATKVGRKKFGPNGYLYDRAEQLNEDEYNISRQIKQIQIVVKPK